MHRNNRKEITNFMTTRIVHMAMMMGVIMFLGVSFVSLQNREIMGNPMLINAGMAFAIPAVFLAFFLPSRMVPSLKGSQNQLSSYHTVKIVQWAILEGAALLNGVAYFTSGDFRSLATAVGLVFVILSRFPSEAEMNKMFPEE
ncbi:MAG: hypothetical protein KDK36_12030 [Leptospiraceae bacterium]|nr:hypothetical protein [Leptospiraceae bacterium]